MPTLRRLLNSRPVLLIAFAFAVMGDPVSSVAYAIEAALRALDGQLCLLLATMAWWWRIIALVIVNYHRLVARFPGGGDAAAAGTAFGEGWAFLPLGSLIVDYALTIAISCSAARLGGDRLRARGSSRRGCRCARLLLAGGRPDLVRPRRPHAVRAR